MLETREWTFLDRSKWKMPELAEGEPDKVQWEDPETGLPCLIHRGGSGSWCGYVGVDKSHPLYEKDYNVPDVDIHGGLTFSDFCRESEENGRGICHVTQDHEKVWWLGFDCAHSGDLNPLYGREMGWSDFAVYRRMAYAKNEVRKLARQLKDLAKVQ